MNPTSVGHTPRIAILSLLIASLLIAAPAITAQAPQSNSGFQPTVGQPGKDVVWVPTPQATVDKMLELAKITPQDQLIDLGSGDGRLVITAAKRGLKPDILNMRPGTRIVSNTFTMGDWAADQTAVVPNCPNYCTALLWIVPAKVNGTWKLPQGELKLTQTYQTFTGTLGNAAISNGKLVGEQISFDAGGTRYQGRVNGNTIQGTIGTGTTTSFTATRG